MSDEVTFESFLPLILPYMPNVPEALAVSALRSAAIELCEASHIWMCEHDPIDISAGVNNYEFDPPCDAIVCRVHLAWYDGCAIQPRTEDELQAAYGTDWLTETGTPRAFVQFSTDEIILVPVPDTRLASGLKLTVALKPSQESLTIAATIYERWAEKIAYGARARLHETPGQTYYHPPSAVKFRTLFHEGVALAKIERNRGLTRRAPVMRFPNVI